MAGEDTRLNVTGSVLSANHAGSQGGAIFVSNGACALRVASFASNSAANGGAFYQSGGTGRASCLLHCWRMCPVAQAVQSCSHALWGPVESGGWPVGSDAVGMETVECPC